MTGLQIWTIYDHPSDYPDRWVVRWMLVTKGELIKSKMAQLYATLEEARAGLPPGLICIGRNADDDPVIKEVWL